MPPNYEYVREWFEIADKDFDRALKRIAEGDWEDAGFRIQQAVEKYLKGYLALHERKFRLIHDLEELLESAIEVDDDFEEYRDACRRITTYYMWDRYPRILEEPLTESEIRKAIKWAEKIRKKVKNET